MKILVLCYEYPPVGGGGGRVAATVAKALLGRGHEVRICTAALGSKSVEENDQGVPVIRIRSFRKKADTCSVAEMGLYLLTSFLPVLRQIDEWEPDVIHAHFAVPTGALAYAMERLTHVPYVLTAHLGDVPGGVPEQTGSLFRLIKPLTNPIWKKAAGITAVSTFVADLAAKAYGRKTEVIPNGIPLPPPPSPRNHSPLRILWVGRLSIQKNPLLAIESLAQIAFLPWELHIAGEGPLRREMEQCVARLQLQDRVQFHGWQEASQIADRMRSSDLLLMTSRSEGFPMVIVEALSQGLPVVATDIPALRGLVIPGENGLICDASPKALASALQELIENSSKRREFERGARASATRYDIHEIARRYEAILTKAAAK